MCMCRYTINVSFFLRYSLRAGCKSASYSGQSWRPVVKTRSSLWVRMCGGLKSQLYDWLLLWSEWADNQSHKLSLPNKLLELNSKDRIYHSFIKARPDKFKSFHNNRIYYRQFLTSLFVDTVVQEFIQQNTNVHACTSEPLCYVLWLNRNARGEIKYWVQRCDPALLFITMRWTQNHGYSTEKWSPPSLLDNYILLSSLYGKI